MKYTFPEGFMWGAATSGPQSEGRFHKAHRNLFDYWFDHDPGKFFAGVGPNVTSNFYNDYREDAALMRRAGVKSLRTSIQWSRLIRDFETAEPDPEAVLFYNSMITNLIKEGITPILNLHHFDMPYELYKKYGGWESRHVVELFAKFARRSFELFGDRVHLWTTFNEPMVVVEGAYLYQFHYPLLVDGKKAVQAIYNLNLASALAVAEFKKSSCCREFGGKIGIVINLTPAYPRSESPEDRAASEFAELFKNRAFLDPAVLGHFPAKLVERLAADGVLWQGEAADEKVIKDNTVDFLGVNYYHPCRVKARTAPVREDTWMPDKYFEEYEWKEARMNKYRGWEIYPKALYDIAINIRDNYGNIPWYVAENGMGVEGEEKFRAADGTIADDYRIEFFAEHLAWLSRAIQEGANCHGYHVWTPIDCWSWMNAYKNRYGLIALDLATQKKTLKKSAHWFYNLAENNGFEGKEYGA